MFKKTVLSLAVISLALVWGALSLSTFAEPLTIAYTGNTYSSLYPCGVCPASVGGGVTRRSAALLNMAASSKLILVDSGNFTASGIFDRNSANLAQDKQRSLVYYQAMALMGYEVVGVGENEFAFGIDFLSRAAEEFSFNFVSSNIEIKGVKPYQIKEIAGKSIGFVGLTPRDIDKKLGIAVGDYGSSLKKVIEEIQDRCDMIILLSSIGEEATLSLIDGFPQITAVLLSGRLSGSKEFENIKGVFLARPAQEGKSLYFLKVASADASTGDITFSQQRLSLDHAQDSDLKSVIPACFQDRDCRQRESLIGKCQAGGELASECVYYDAEIVDATIITDESCDFCSTELAERALSDIFIGIRFRRLDYQTLPAQELIKKYKAVSLPLIVIDKKISKEKNFDKIREFLKESNDGYILSSDIAGMFTLLEREKVHRRVDFFVDLYDSTTATVFEKLRQFCKKEKITLNLYFIKGDSRKSGQAPEEVDVALAVADAFPAKINDYLLLRLDQIKKTSWVNTLDELKINYKTIQAALRAKKIEKLRSLNEAFIAAIGVREGNVMLLNNNRIFKVYDIDGEELRKIFAETPASKAR